MDFEFGAEFLNMFRYVYYELKELIQIELAAILNFEKLNARWPVLKIKCRYYFRPNFLNVGTRVFKKERIFKQDRIELIRTLHTDYYLSIPKICLCVYFKKSKIDPAKN